MQVRVVEHGLVLQQLLYSDEVRSFDEVTIPGAKVNDTELKLAKQLIDSITTDSGFDASKYHDDVKERIEQMIAQKVSGREITAPEAPAAPESARVIDLMQALRASLKSRTEGRREGCRPWRGSRCAREPFEGEARACGQKGRTAARAETRRVRFSTRRARTLPATA